MPRARSPEGKHETISARVTEQDAAEIDRLRGGLTRSAWFESLIQAELIRARNAEARLKRDQQPADDCPHPPARRQKGLCMACGHPVP